MKKVICVFVAIIMLFLFCGCSDSEGNKIVGIQQINGSDCYFITIPYGHSVSEYCTPIGLENFAIIDYIADWEGPSKTYSVKYQQIRESGWVAYVDQKMLIMPRSFTAAQARMASTRLATNEGDYMSLSEASKYLSWIKTN